MSTGQNDEKLIFEAASVLTTPEEQTAYVEKVCAADPAMKVRILALLKAHEGKGDFLEALLDEPSVTLDDLELKEEPGTVIGQYKLLEKIGEGGMAVVYMAEQERPIRRKVALKIIKLGMDTKSVIARFEVERQALAMMDHPNIAKVLDAGATETGRPYFVMDLVPGVCITEYCDKNRLNIKERLNLFISVCSAIQHAHQKGIIHRDIKPSNILVTLHDGQPVPKVIDFGIAKATNQRLTEKTLFTRYAHIIGTPAYMSPEQAELSDLDVDTRTDIYSLGALLYELLTGSTPFSVEELHEAGYLQMQKIICEAEPTKPSTKLSTLGKTLTDVTRLHGSSPELMPRLVRGDLDWIVMKALEKDRARRYGGASDFAVDIERHLENRPVLAHAPSASYHARKFLLRNRLQTIAGLAAVIMVCTIIVLSLLNQHQVRLAEAEGARDVDALSEARGFVSKGDFKAARDILAPILGSKYVGLRARNLLARVMDGTGDYDSTVQPIMNIHHLERVHYFSGKIQADTKDPNNYLQRAQQYKYLREEENVHADMNRYATLLGQDWFSRYRFGTPKIVKPVMSTPSLYHFKFSLTRREDGILVTSIAFVQKGNTTMKSCEIPILLTSVITLCLLPNFEMSPLYADFQFGPPINSGTTGTIATCISKDGLELYSSTVGTNPNDNLDIMVAKRDTIDDNWSDPVPLAWPINTQYIEGGAKLLSDGLTLYFVSNRPGGYGNLDVWMTTRQTKDAPWGQPVNLGSPANTSADEAFLSITDDGLELYLSDWTAYKLGGYGGRDIWVSRRPTKNDPWGEPVNIGSPVNTSGHETVQSITRDGLIMFIRCYNRTGGYGSHDIWMTKRTTIKDDWGEPINCGPLVNTANSEELAYISPDGSNLFYFRLNAQWQTPIFPIVDFNGDGRVDGKDVLCMAAQWSTDDHLCDIGSFAWGDGIVDLQDVVALSEYVGKEVIDSTLVAHWLFDETEGMTTRESVTGNDTYTVGDPIWEPTGGQIDGALRLDGVDDCVVASSALNPAEGRFSILAWVKGGAPGQVIVSRITKANCLMVDDEGRLMTELGGDGRSGVPLLSETIITDGQWHRIAFVWDGSR